MRGEQNGCSFLGSSLGHSQELTEVLRRGQLNTVRALSQASVPPELHNFVLMNGEEKSHPLKATGGTI